MFTFSRDETKTATVDNHERPFLLLSLSRHTTPAVAGSITAVAVAFGWR